MVDEWVRGWVWEWAQQLEMVSVADLDQQTVLALAAEWVWEWAQG
jgi:hypothetical protein